MPRLADVTLTTIKRCWADELGCAPEHFDTDQTVVVPHLGFGDYYGVFMFRWDKAVVASVPPQLLSDFGPRLEQLDAAQFVPEACVQAVGAAMVERVIGPAYYGYADATVLRPMTSAGVRALARHDAPHLEQLHRACREAEWEEAGRAVCRRAAGGGGGLQGLVELPGPHLCHHGSGLPGAWVRQSGRASQRCGGLEGRVSAAISGVGGEPGVDRTCDSARLPGVRDEHRTALEAASGSINSGRDRLLRQLAQSPVVAPKLIRFLLLDRYGF